MRRTIRYGDLGRKQANDANMIVCILSVELNGKDKIVNGLACMV